MTYLVLLLTSIILLLLATRIFKMKLHSPTVLFLSGYILSIMSAYVGLGSWNSQKELSLTTILITILSMTSFCAGDIFVEKFKRRSKEINKTPKYDETKNIRPKRLLVALSIILYILCAIFIIKDIKSICGSYSCGASSLPEMISFYRTKTGLFSAQSASLSTITTLLIQITNALSVYYIYIFISNLYKKDKFKNNVLYLIPILFCIALGLLRSGRSSVIVYISAAVVIYIFQLLKKDSSERAQSHSKIFKKVTAILTIVLLAFYLAAPLIGRATERSPLEYISFYIGCPIPSLNIALENDTHIEASSPLGNSLYGLRSIASDLGIKLEAKERSLPFIEMGGFGSNVYTSIYRLYSDFGLFTSLLFVAASGAFFGYIHKVASRKNDYRIKMFYALLSSRMIDMCRDETFYTLTLSKSTIINLLLILFICCLFYNSQPEPKHES